MPTKRDIREKALLSLFSSATTEDSTFAEEPHWELVLELENKAITKSAVKALRHQLQSYSKVNKELQQYAPNISTLLKTYEEKALARQLLRVAKDTKALEERVLLLGNKSDQEELERFYLRSTPLKHSLSSLISELSASGYSAPEKEDFDKCLKKLADLLERIDMVSAPLEHKEEGSIKPLIKLCAEREALHTAAKELSENTVAHLSTLDEKIETQLENFSSTQIGKVERNLLRLATYELLILEVPKPVVINEALELAKKYATEDAVPLINGVLDKMV